MAVVQEAITGAVAFSPDGAKLLVLCAGSLTTWDLHQQQQQQGVLRPVKLQVQEGVPVCSILPKAARPCFSPDGKWLAVVLNQQHVCIYSTAVGGLGMQQEQSKDFSITNLFSRAFNSVFDKVVSSTQGAPAVVNSSIKAYCSSAIEAASSSMETFAKSMR